MSDFKVTKSYFLAYDLSNACVCVDCAGRILGNEEMILTRPRLDQDNIARFDRTTDWSEPRSLSAIQPRSEIRIAKPIAGRGFRFASDRLETARNQAYTIEPLSRVATMKLKA